MADLNVVALTGRIAAAPQLIEKGKLRVARLQLVVEAMRRNSQSGELEPRDHFFNVAVFGAPATEASQLPAGTRVGVHGRLSHSRYTDRDGTARESVEITTGEWVRALESRSSSIATPQPGRGDAARASARNIEDLPDSPLPW